MSFCKMTVQGNVGRDPTAAATADGRSVSNFSLVYDEGYKENKKTVFVQVSVFGRTADVCNKYVRKGAALYVEGHPSFDVYKAPDGKIVGQIKLRATDVQFITSKMQTGWGAPGYGAPVPADAEAQYGYAPQAQARAPQPFNDDGLPDPNPNAPETPPDGMDAGRTF